MRQKGTSRALVGWLLVLLSASLCLSSVWDADGNPNTDNLPAVALPTGVRTTADIESLTEEHHDENEGEVGHLWGRRIIGSFSRRAPLFRHHRWRRLAIPLRGP